MKFYGTAKLHKVPNNSTVQQLPFKPIIYNNGTATYDLAKYLAELLKPWSKLQYTIKNGNTLTKKSRKSRFLLFLKSLFTSAFLDQRIDIIIKRIIYDKKKIYPDMPKKKEMRELLYVCTNNTHLNIDNKTYIQVDEVAIHSG